MRLALCSMIVCVLATVSHAEPLQWQKDVSPKALGIAAAERFCNNKGTGWRLPNRVELASLLVDPAAEDGRFVPNAVVPPEGYLWSGEQVSPGRKGQMWIMNLRNGHIFNGSGLAGYAKCVNGKPTKPPEVTLGAPITTIGRADAKVVSLVAMQPDAFWFKVRPVLDKLAATRSVRFEVHFYLTDIETYLPDSLVLCAAAKVGTFDEVEKQLAASKVDPKWAHLESDVMKTCAAQLDRDQTVFGQKDVPGVPAFLIGKQIIVGAQPIETFEAAIKAASKPE